MRSACDLAVQQAHESKPRQRPVHPAVAQCTGRVLSGLPWRLLWPRGGGRQRAKPLFYPIDCSVTLWGRLIDMVGAALLSAGTVCIGCR